MPSLRVAHPVVDLWQEPRRADRVSQLIQGAPVVVVDDRGDWVRIEGPDRYRGWAERRLLAETDGPTLTVRTAFAELRASADPTSPLVVRLPMHAGLDGAGGTVSGWTAARLPDGRCGYLPSACVAEPDHRDHVAWAREFLGTPYLWGGSSSFGLDCSGYVQLLYAIGGVTLRRDADIQRADPRFLPVAFSDLAPGDLVFFGTPDKITHVGMHLGGERFIHASGGVGVVINRWDEANYATWFVDGRRLDPARAADPVTRFEAENR